MIASTMSHRVALLANGELYLLESNGESRAIRSQFIADAEKREAKSQDINAWKSDATE